MNTSDVKILLDKYWNCDTSLDEEQQLKTYFASSNVDPSLSEYVDVFALLNSEAQISTEFAFPSKETLQIHELVDKYFDCNTTLEEETALKTYFTSQNVDSSLRQYSDLFNVLHSEGNIKAGNITIQRKLEVTSKESTHEVKSFSISKKWIGIAASLLLVGVLWFNTDILNPKADTAFAEYAVDSEDEALEVTMEALAFLSGKLDKSTTKIKKDIKRVSNASLLK